VSRARSFPLAPFHAEQRVCFDEDKRGTILPLLRDEPLTIVVVENRGTRKKPEWWALCKSDRLVGNKKTLAYQPERFVNCECLRTLVK
jgi:hypothetical protein